MAESLGVEMPVTASDYQSLIRIKELEERIAELEKDNAEQAKIITEQAKLIEELKAKLARYEIRILHLQHKDIVLKRSRSLKIHRGVVLQMDIEERPDQHLSPIGW